MHRIDLNNVIKVADFGLSEKMYSSKSYFRIEVAGQGGVKLPVKWMAIESLNDDIFSEKTDVVNCLWKFTKMLFYLKRFVSAVVI